MEITQEQKLFQQIVNEAWENAEFKTELVSNPIKAIEKLTGEKLNIPKGKTFVVRDQTDESTVYINIPAQPQVDVELNEEQLEAVAGGTNPPGCWEDPDNLTSTVFNPFKGIIIK